MDADFEPLEIQSKIYIDMLKQQKNLHNSQLARLSMVHGEDQEQSYRLIEKLRKEPKAEYEFKQKELEQVRMVMQDMNDLLVEKLRCLKYGNKFQEREKEQEKILQDEFQQELFRSNDNKQNVNSEPANTQLVSLISKIDTILENESLDEKQKSNLVTARKNIALGLID